MSNAFGISEISYVHRVVVGNSDPNRMKGEAEIQAQMAKVNECLSRSPKGIIIGIEKNFGIYQVAEHQMALQSMTYHIGFIRKPAWIEEV